MRNRSAVARSEPTEGALPRMYANAFRRVYFYHLKKCGGTSLNHWLGQQVADDRVYNPAWLKPLAGAFLDESKVPADIERTQQAIGASVFHWTDAVYSHFPLRRWAPADTLCMTVLRDPVERLVSQVADWRRLSARDYADAPGPVATLIRDASAMPLRRYLETHGRGNFLFDNYLVRALAATRLGFAVKAVEKAEDLAADALESLTQSFHVVGLTAQLGLTLNAVAERLGRVPEDAPPSLNQTRSRVALSDETRDAEAILMALTNADRPLYAQAEALFEQRHARAGATYNRGEFERLYAADALAQLAGRKRGDAVVYSVRAPLVGCGFHGRDASGTANCRSWSGPANRSVIYMPVPAGRALTLRLWVHGYAADSKRERLRCFVDGAPAPHRFAAEDGYRDVIEIDARPHRGFAALEIDVGETLPAGLAGSPEHDARLRGLSVDQYGWTVRPDHATGV